MSLVLLKLKQLSYKRLHKLKSYGVSGKLFYHISSFLSGRSFEVALDEKSSSQVTMLVYPRVRVLEERSYFSTL